MKRFLLFLGVFLFAIPVYAKEEEPANLYSRSAVLMDADSGRVLFGKNEDEIRAMASTTKIMTCILALENEKADAVVTVSKRAAAQPRVHLGVREGEQFYLEDLLYSLMLESHNDVAVAIAEHVGGSVEAFACLMNEKAEELGCRNTHFVTPNGLDAVDEGGKHTTTAAELAMIMRYCVRESPERSRFLKITQTQSRQFTSVEGTRSFSCNNHNAFLNMMDGVISGKTGFTGDAGYCYVGAIERDGRTFIAVVLACGWPNHKGYKWSDTKKLMEYGIRNYFYQDVFEEQVFTEAEVVDGIPESGELFCDAKAGLKLKAREGERSIPLLLREGENVEIKVSLRKKIHAPVKKGEEAGSVEYYLEDKLVRRYPVVFAKTVEEKQLFWYFRKVCEKFFCAG